MKNKLLSFLTIFFSIISLSVAAQQVSVPMQYYDKVQHTRDKASDLWGKKDPSAAEIAKGIQMLKNAVKLLDSIPVQELAEGNIYLDGRRHDVYMDLVSAYAVANQKDLAFEYLDKMYNQGTYSSGVLPYLAKDSSFMNLRNDQRYTTFMDKLKRAGDLYGNVALKTPYKSNLSEDEKVAGLSLLWMMARNNFVYFDHLTTDWNQTYLNYLPLVRNTKSTAEYYKILIRFYAGLNDGHTNVYVPDTLDADFYSRPPMRSMLIEGRVFVTEVFNDSLVNMGIKPGLEVIKIDSEPVIPYAEKNVKPYESSSTPQDMQVREFYYALFAGPAKKPITFEFKDRNGKLFTKVIARTGYHDNKYPNSVIYQNINNIGYLQVNQFESESINKQVDSLFKNEIPKTKGLIIDVRYNGGGSSYIGYHIISKLTDTSFKTSASQIIRYYSRPGEELDWAYNPGENWPADGKIYYNKPVVVLTGPETFSAAEDFVVAFDYMKRGKLIGGPTGGSTGQPISFNLPGGGSARVCAKRDTYPNGKEFIGKGVMPDIQVTNTIKDLMTNTDAAKNKALDLLSKETN
jgi:carboxyl-terminal processing protease